MIISERIFNIMEERNISQIEFSRATGISQSTISDWKRKKTNPASDKIMKICKVLDVSPYELLQDSESDEGDIDNDFTAGLTVTKGGEKYELLVEYEKLDKSSKDRLLGYLRALRGL